MKIIEPSVEIITEPNPLRRIELCGRVCYKSEDKITPDSALRFVERIIKSGHTSVLEHARVKVPVEILDEIIKLDNDVDPYGSFYRTKEWFSSFFMNARDFIAEGGTLDQLAIMKNASDYMTVRFICDRGISHELVRHRVFSFSQESTRYVDYHNRGMEFILPLPFEWANDKNSNLYCAWFDGCKVGEYNYRYMIENGCNPQEARSVLPNSLKTELIMTGTFDQWRDMLKLRSALSAHPQMRYLMGLLTNNEKFVLF